MKSLRFKKGDLVIVDDSGKPAQFEILTFLSSGKGARLSGEPCYEAKNVITGMKKTITEDEILRLATPVDDSSELFNAQPNRVKKNN